MSERAKRLSEEDFCQLLKIDPRHKYEAIGGPGIEDSFALLRALELSAAETIAFLERIVFNFLVGNGDAHGKNFSVIYEGRKCRLAPMYDIMSTAVYPEVGKRMAMKVDGEYAFKWMTSGKFVRMAEGIGVSEKVMMTLLRRQVAKISKAAPKLAKRFQREYPSTLYDEILAGIDERAKQVK